MRALAKYLVGLVVVLLVDAVLTMAVVAAIGAVIETRSPYPPLQHVHMGSVR